MRHLELHSKKATAAKHFESEHLQVPPLNNCSAWGISEWLFQFLFGSSHLHIEDKSKTVRRPVGIDSIFFHFKRF